MRKCIHEALIGINVVIVSVFNKGNDVQLWGQGRRTNGNESLEVGITTTEQKAKLNSSVCSKSGDPDNFYSRKPKELVCEIVGLVTSTFNKSIKLQWYQMTEE